MSFDGVWVGICHSRLVPSTSWFRWKIKKPWKHGDVWKAVRAYSFLQAYKLWDSLPVSIKVAIVPARSYTRALATLKWITWWDQKVTKQPQWRVLTGGSKTTWVRRSWVRISTLAIFFTVEVSVKYYPQPQKPHSKISYRSTKLLITFDRVMPQKSYRHI